jgi:hypothetical protein
VENTQKAADRVFEASVSPYLLFFTIQTALHASLASAEKSRKLADKC